MTRTRRTPQETVLTRPARVTRQSRASRSIDRTSRARNANSESPFPPLRSLSPSDTRVKVEAGTASQNALMLSVEENKVKDEGQFATSTADLMSNVKKEDSKVASLETDEVKLAELRLASVDQPVRAADSPRPSSGNLFQSIQTLLGTDSERRNTEVYQEFLESYGLVTRMAAAICSYWSPDTWFRKQATPSPDQNQFFEAFRAEFLDCIKGMQDSLSHVYGELPVHVALLQAIRRFMGHLFRMSSNVLEQLHTTPNDSGDLPLEARISLVDDLVHLLGEVIARMIMIAKRDMAFPHQVNAHRKMQSAVAVSPRLQGLGFPPNLLLPQFMTGNLIVANAEFL